MIYFIQDSRSLDIKIGYTGSDTVTTRLNALQTGNAGKLEVLACVPGEQSDEAALHRKFASARIGGEWFRPTTDLLRHIAFMVIGRGMYEEGRESGYMDGFSAGYRDRDAETPFLELDTSWRGPIIDGQSGPLLLLKCPVCGFNYNHIGCGRPLSGYGDFPPPPDALNWAGRGSGHALEMHGECGHTWFICLGFHKGNSHLFVTVPEQEPANQLPAENRAG